jgi:chromosome segregation ATPase
MSRLVNNATARDMQE